MKAISITTGELTKQLGCRLDGDADLLLKSVTTIEEADSNQLTFLANPRYRKFLPDCRAGAIIVDENEDVPVSLTRLISKKPYQDFRRAIEIFYAQSDQETIVEISPLSNIDKSVVLGENVQIQAFVEIGFRTTIGSGCRISNGVCIGQDVILGDNCVIGHNVVIRSDIRIGNRVIIGDGTVLGFDGFGYAPDEGKYNKILQVGTVVIEDDVEIGANCCIDRATVGVTKIGRGSKLDNLIQVAHGVKIGENTVIAAQTGISGSTTIGSRVMVGGQVGFSGHIEIGDGMMIGAQAGVTKSVDIKGVVSGYPARPHGEALRRDANISRLPKLIQRIKELENKIEKLTESKK
ncbi:MAG: UDP-3-O-(3-hydroxymyristoyl)glucosamine N-acyltransferase [Candidatus Hatepunaea meridiana]|nr:UDP-3-O-(3-hydroxymyristoyl)glucosamine N-acyltransferase [Candidatus Hatepunaea meridiana]